METAKIISEHPSIETRIAFIKSQVDLDLMASQWLTWKYELMDFSIYSWMSASCLSNLGDVMIDVDRIYYKALRFIDSYRYIPLVEFLQAVRISTVSLNRYWISLLYQVKMENSNQEEMNDLLLAFISKFETNNLKIRRWSMRVIFLYVFLEITYTLH